PRLITAGITPPTNSKLAGSRTFATRWRCWKAKRPPRNVRTTAASSSTLPARSLRPTARAGRASAPPRPGQSRRSRQRWAPPVPDRHATAFRSWRLLLAPRNVVTLQPAAGHDATVAGDRRWLMRSARVTGCVIVAAAGAMLLSAGPASAGPAAAASRTQAGPRTAPPAPPPLPPPPPPPTPPRPRRHPP